MSEPRPSPSEMVPRPPSGRVFHAERRVRLGDVTMAGSLRVDACARYLQDVARDDSADSGIENPMGWVVRRTVLHVVRPPEFQELVQLDTWCSGVGSRWAERRTTITGEHGGLVEAMAIWVHIDPVSGKPMRLGPGFDERYAESAAGRKADARLHHDPVVPDRAERRPWAWRATDFDVLAHVNNAAYGAVVEEALASRSPEDPAARRAPMLVEMEYRDPALPGSQAALAVVADGADGDDWSLGIWLLADDRPCFTARVSAAPASESGPTR